MKIFKKTTFTLLYLFLLTVNLSAENKINYIDLDKILANTVAGKSLFQQLNILEKSKLELLENEGKKLKEEENKILSSKNLLSQEEYIKRVNVFKKKIPIYQKKKKDIINGLKEKRNSEVIRFLKMINSIIESIMEENSIDILLEKKNIFIAKSNTDITNIVIEYVDNNIKDFIIKK